MSVKRWITGSVLPGSLNSACGNRRADVLVGTEQVGWVVDTLDGNQPVIDGIAVGRADAVVALLTEVVDVGAAGVGRDRPAESAVLADRPGALRRSTSVFSFFQPSPRPSRPPVLVTGSSVRWNAIPNIVRIT
jgi:hypothetical protein